MEKYFSKLKNGDDYMKINEVTERSRDRAEKLAEREGGFLVPVYAVVKTDSEGRVARVMHDHLNDVNFIEEE